MQFLRCVAAEPSRGCGIEAATAALGVGRKDGLTAPFATE